MLTVLSLVFGLAGLVCSIIILIDAFEDALWKGLLCLFCGLYGLYFALAEFDHKNKWLIVAGALIFGGLSSGLRFMAR